MAGEVNTAMPSMWCTGWPEALNERKNRSTEAASCCLGLAYKRTWTMRANRPATPARLLRARGAQVAYYDPHVRWSARRASTRIGRDRSVAWDEATVRGFDLVLIATHHDAVNYQQLADGAAAS